MHTGSRRLAVAAAVSAVLASLLIPSGARAAERSVPEVRAKALQRGASPAEATRTALRAAASKPWMITKPIKAKAYKMQVMAGGSSSASWMTVDFVQGGANNYKVHWFDFSLPAKAWTANKAMTKVSLDTGSAMGSYGKVKMSSRVGPGKVSTVRKYGGCTGGKWRVRSGTLKGTFKFDAGDGYFKLAKKKIPIQQVVKELKPAKKCKQPPPVPCLTMFAYAYSQNDGSSAVAFHYGDKVDLTASSYGMKGKASVLSAAGSRVSPDRVSVAANRLSATVTGAGHFDGQMTLTALDPPGLQSDSDTCGPYDWGTGSASGDFGITFENGESIRPAQGPDALGFLQYYQ